MRSWSNRAHRRAVAQRAETAGVRVITDDGEPDNVLRALHPLDFLASWCWLPRSRRLTRDSPASRKAPRTEADRKQERPVGG